MSSIRGGLRHAVAQRVAPLAEFRQGLEVWSATCLQCFLEARNWARLHPVIREGIAQRNRDAWASIAEQGRVRTALDRGAFWYRLQFGETTW